MTDSLPNQPGPIPPDDDLDQLVRQAMDEHSLAPDNRSDPYEVDRLWYRQQRMKYAICAFVILLLAGGATWFFVDKHLKNKADAAYDAEIRAKQEALLADLAQKIPAEVRALIASNNFGLARTTLDKARGEGMPGEVWVVVDAELTRALAAHCGRLFEEIEAELDERAVEKANALLEQARSLEVPGDLLVRLTALESRFQEVKRLAELEPAKRMLADSRRAAINKDYDEAISLVERARKLPREGPDLELWANELREMVGGRVLVVGSPAEAKVEVSGLPPVKIGEQLAGLSFGGADFVVSAEGYLPERGHADASYPAIARINVDLVPEAPGPVWATHVLAGRCAQRVATSYYLEDGKSDDWAEAVKAVGAASTPCEASDTNKKKDRDELLKDALKEFERERDRHGVLALDELGEFLAAYPGSAEILFDRCRSDVRPMLAQIEHGCADCWGAGNRPCEGCKARGKRKELRTCTACKGTGQKRHVTCNGTGKIKCKKCKGKGTIRKRRKEGKDWLTRSEPCTACTHGKIDCICGNGQITCSKCKGDGKRKTVGDCSECSGKGTVPCDVCSGSGSRSSMEVDRRRELELAIARLSHP